MGAAGPSAAVIGDNPALPWERRTIRVVGEDNPLYVLHDMRQTELAVIDTSAGDLDQVTAIPDTVLRHSREIDHWSLPFRIAVRNFYQNSRLKMLSQAGEGARPIANQGPGAMIAVEPVMRATASETRAVFGAAAPVMPLMET